MVALAPYSYNNMNDKVYSLTISLQPSPYHTHTSINETSVFLRCPKFYFVHLPKNTHRIVQVELWTVVPVTTTGKRSLVFRLSRKPLLPSGIHYLFNSANCTLCFATSSKHISSMPRSLLLPVYFSCCNLSLEKGTEHDFEENSVIQVFFIHPFIHEKKLPYWTLQETILSHHHRLVPYAKTDPSFLTVNVHMMDTC